MLCCCAGMEQALLAILIDNLWCENRTKYDTGLLIAIVGGPRALSAGPLMRVMTRLVIRGPLSLSPDPHEVKYALHVLHRIAHSLNTCAF